MGTRTRSPEAPDLPSEAELARLKLSPEVAHYLLTRGIPLPDCPPAIKTPEPGEVLPDAMFDPLRVDRVLAAFALLRHTKGRWAGKPLRPDPWQVAYILAPVFGWVHGNDDGRLVRCINEGFIDVSRKNGKSTVCGGVGIYLTCADGEQGAEVLAAATTEKQAGFVFSPIKALAAKSPALKPHVRPLAKKILHPTSGSYFEVVSSVAEAAHGGNIHGAVVDELHLHPSGDLVEAIETGTGSREQPLILFITTADDGKPGTIYARKRRTVEQLSERVITDTSVYGVVWCASEADDPFDEATWRKANPGYGISPTAEYLRRKANKARNDPAELGAFLRLHLGVRTKQVTRYLTLPDWDATAGVVDEAQLEGRTCYGGLDLASVEDFTALAWVFPAPFNTFDAVFRFWIPADRRHDLAKRTAGESEVWISRRLLRLIPGAVIDDDVVIADVIADAQRFQVKTLGFDRMGARHITNRLGEGGIDCVPIGQGYLSMSPPMKEILALTKQKALRHGAHPIMRWMVDNLTVATDSAGNVKPDKSKSADKIDGVAALAMAVKECMADDEGDVDTSVVVFR